MKHRILEAAGDLFYGEGILTVSVDSIAARAGITKRTLYYHFKSKDELIAAYLESRNGPTLSRLMTACTAVEGSLADQIAGLFQWLARAGQNPAWKGCAFARAAAELAGSPDHPALRVAVRHKAEFEAWLEHRITTAGLPEPALRARQIMTLVDGSITQMLIHRNPEYARAAGLAAVAVLRPTRVVAKHQHRRRH